MPLYAFTKIGVGGVVMNRRGEVLMVQERTASPKHQGSWKLPGGLADPGESFSDAAMREIREEVPSVAAGLHFTGVASLYHTHGLVFGQSDIYVLVLLHSAAEPEAELDWDPDELVGAQWMSLERIEAIAATPSEASLAGR